VQALRRYPTDQTAKGEGVSKTKTVAESRYLARVAQLSCVLCEHLGVQQEGRTTVHHLKEGTGIGQRQQHWIVAALCHDHHQGANGIHGLGTKGFYTRYRLDELDLLAMTIQALDSRLVQVRRVA
jgi:predicted N-acetyltransferase YhbS